MQFPGMTLDQYLEILAQATPEDGPFTGHEEEAALNTGFAELAKGMIAFMKAAEPIIGYEEARSMVEDVTHTFPVEKNPEPFDPFAALQEALLRAMAEAPEVFGTEADGPDGAPKES